MSRLPVVVSLVLAAFTASASAFLRPGSFDPHADSCPLERAMEDFDMSKVSIQRLFPNMILMKFGSF